MGASMPRRALVRGRQLGEEANMNGYGFLVFSLGVGILGIGLYKAGPMLDRWSVRLKGELERLRRGEN